MSQTNYTPISLYYSTTAAAAPTAGNLVSGELAINITDGKLFYKDNAGAVQTLATKAATSGIFGAISVTSETNSGTLTLSGGTANGVAYLNGSNVVTTGSALTFDGTNLGVGVSTAYARLQALGTIKVATGNAQGILSLGDGNGTTVNVGLWRGAANAPTTDGNFLNLGGYDGMVFAVGAAAIGSQSEQMRLNSTGLGIGTSSPAQKLHVENNANSSTWVKVANTNSGSGAAAGVLFTNNGGDLGAISLLSSANSPANSLFLRTLSTNTLTFGTGNTVQATLDSSGNLGLGVTPSAWVSPALPAFDIGTMGAIAGQTNAANLHFLANAYLGSGPAWKYKTSNYASRFTAGNDSGTGGFSWYNAPSGTAGNAITFTQAMTLTAGGNLLVGGTSSIDNTIRAEFTGQGGLLAASTDTASSRGCISAWQQHTAGDNKFVFFYTEATPTLRGSISYNRGAGLVAYNVTSDYRAKDIIGSVENSGALIDSVPVYMGKMKGATQERPMFIAHETPAYAHTGEKDAVDADGNPVYQQMDASALVPVMWAEIQSLRKRLATLESK